MADTVVSRENGVEVTKTNLYDYSPNNYKVSNIRSGQSDGSEMEKKVYYPVDYLSNVGSSTLLSKMISRNLVNIPIEEITTSTIGGVSKLVSGTAYEYGVNTLPGFDQFYLKRLYQADDQDALPNGRYNFLGIPSHYVEKVHTLSVNAYGLPTYRIIDSVQRVAYVWGYNNQYPIAEIKNADYTSVETVLGGATAVNTFTAQANPSESSTIDFLAPLRAAPFSNGKLVTSFTYRPLVGHLRMTDPKGMNTYYEYDNFNRLSMTRDYLGNIVKSYNYHYGGTEIYHNSFQSQSFIRNNCGPGYEGSSATYVVAAGTYSSTLSQADANAQAMADIAANGQNYVNANASCTPLQGCTRFRITIPVSVSNDLYINYRACGEASYSARSLMQLPDESWNPNEIVVQICIEGMLEDFSFQYGQFGYSQSINGITIQNLGVCP